MRMQLVAALKPDAQSDGRASSPAMPGDRFHAVLIVEEEWTGDGRFFKAGSIAWRDLPLPMMALDETTAMPHEKARMIGHIDTIERVGAEIHAWGSYLPTTDEEILRLQDGMRSGYLRWVSADMDDPEYEIIIPAEMMAEPTEQPDGSLRMPGGMILTEFSHVRVLGATALPFQALDGAQLVYGETETETEAPPEDLNPEDETERAALAASAARKGWGFVDCECNGPTPAASVKYEPPPIVSPNLSPITLLASAEPSPIQAPVVPPAPWFRNPQLKAATATTLTDEGQMFGHLAAWDSCHIGFADRCVTPPRSASNYAYFRTGEILLDDGSRTTVGQITLNTGHAPMNANAAKAVAHYDHTGWAVADVAVGEDRYGIWFAGALRPGLSAEAVRALMACELSGDWRRIGGGMELVAALGVNVPGFMRPRVQARHDNGMLASLVACLPVVESRPVADLPPDIARYAVEKIAASVGRSTRQRIAEQVARVKGRN